MLNENEVLKEEDMEEDNRQWVNDWVYIDAVDGRQILYCNGDYMDVTDIDISYEDLYGAQHTNNFWVLYSYADSTNYANYYNKKGKLIHSSKHTRATDENDVMLEKNGYLRIVNIPECKSLVFDIEGTKLMETDDIIQYYNVIDGNEIVVHFKETLILSINSKEYEFKNKEGEFKSKEGVYVNNANEICIIGKGYNAAYNLEFIKLRDLSEEDIKEYTDNGYLYDID